MERKKIDLEPLPGEWVKRGLAAAHFVLKQTGLLMTDRCPSGSSEVTDTHWSEFVLNQHLVSK